MVRGINASSRSRFGPMLEDVRYVACGTERQAGWARTHVYRRINGQNVIIVVNLPISPHTDSALILAPLWTSTNTRDPIHDKAPYGRAFCDVATSRITEEVNTLC